MAVNAVEAWQKMLKQRDEPPASRQETVQLQALAAAHGGPQLAYAIREYGRETLYPRLSDFVAWLRPEELPEELVARALLVDVPEITELAAEYQELATAWYPTEKSTILAVELREKLMRLLA